MATELAARFEVAVAPDVASPRTLIEPSRVWSSLWPKVAAIALGLAAWQVVVWSGWKPDYVLPGPLAVFRRLAQDIGSPEFDLGIAITLRRALLGFAIAVAIGAATGIPVARVGSLRKAVGSASLGLQSMPSIAWFPLATLLFGLHATAIFFVVVLCAPPSIAG